MSLEGQLNQIEKQIDSLLDDHDMDEFDRHQRIKDLEDDAREIERELNERDRWREEGEYRGWY